MCGGYTTRSYRTKYLDMILQTCIVFAVFYHVDVPILASVRKYICTVQQDFGKHINDRVDMKTVFCCSWFSAQFYGSHILLCSTALIVADEHDTRTWLP
jgi:hypothetical protein